MAWQAAQTDPVAVGQKKGEKWTFSEKTGKNPATHTKEKSLTVCFADS